MASDEMRLGSPTLRWSQQPPRFGVPPSRGFGRAPCAPTSPRAAVAQLGFVKRRTVKGITRRATLTILLAATAAFTASCRHTSVSQTPWFGSYGELDSPKDGQMEVCVTGDVKREGVLWVRSGSGIDAVEEMVKPNWVEKEPRKPYVTIFRLASNARVRQFRYNLRKKTQPQKAAIRVQHGDILNFWYGSVLLYSGADCRNRGQVFAFYICLD